MKSSNEMPHIVVVGSTNTDLVASVSSIPRPGETVLGTGGLQIIQGGKGANQAVACARLGASVTFIARVGDDAFGRASLAAFAEEGIDTDFVTVTPGVASGVALISVEEISGQNAITVAPGANAHLSPDDVRAAASAFDKAQAVVLSLEVPLETIEEAARMGFERRIPVILNPAPARALPPDLLAHTTLLTPNEHEAEFLAKADDTPADIHAVAVALLRLGVGAAVVVTLGALGALIATPDGLETVPGLVVHPVDTVAAGDCFTAALAVEFARGKSLRDAVFFANTAAALKVTQAGAQPGLPTREAVEAFRRQV